MTVDPLAPHRGEGPCMDCGTFNTPAWTAPNDLWNLVLGGPAAQQDPGGFLCPWCFAVRAERVLEDAPVWSFRPRGWKT